jgi:hypothetical protein
MPRYANCDGDSGVVSYELGEGSITVVFSDGGTYLYNQQRPGPAVVNHMIALAAAGRGLNSYISTTVKQRYARKMR